MKNNSNVIAHKDVVDAISRLRLDMEDFADGISLVYMDISLGHVLYDLATLIDLTPEEKIQALGLDIIDQIENMPIDIEIVDDPHEMSEFITWPEMTGDQNFTLGNN